MYMVNTNVILKYLRIWQRCSNVAFAVMRYLGPVFGSIYYVLNENVMFYCSSDTSVPTIKWSVNGWDY